MFAYDNRVSHLIGKWHEEGNSEVTLAKWPLSMLHLSDYRRGHLDLDLGLIRPTDVVK